MRERRERGITLIALAVTIVVMLILAGVTIDITLGDKGIINKSKEVADRMNNLVKEDETELNELLNELNETMDSNWNSNIEIPEGNNETGGEGGEDEGGENAGDLYDEGIIQPGDYVAYTPTGLESYVVNGNNSGTGMNQTVTKEDLNWRILDKTQDGKVCLISANPTESTVKLQSADGYNISSADRLFHLHMHISISNGSIGAMYYPYGYQEYIGNSLFIIVNDPSSPCISSRIPRVPRTS